MNAVIDASDQPVVGDRNRLNVKSLLDQFGSSVGEVFLTLSVVGSDSTERGAKVIGVENIDTSVYLANVELLLGCVAVFDNAQETAIAGANNTAVAAWVVKNRGQNRRNASVAEVRID